MYYLRQRIEVWKGIKMRSITLLFAFIWTSFASSETVSIEEYKDNFEGKLVEIRSGVGIYTLAFKLDTKRPSDCDSARNDFLIIPTRNTTAMTIISGSDKQDIIKGRAYLDAITQDCIVERVIRIPR